MVPRDLGTILPRNKFFGRVRARDAHVGGGMGDRVWPSLARTNTTNTQKCFENEVPGTTLMHCVMTTSPCVAAYCLRGHSVRVLSTPGGGVRARNNTYVSVPCCATAVCGSRTRVHDVRQADIGRAPCVWWTCVHFD
jgi:hypothetical protein